MLDGICNPVKKSNGFVIHFSKRKPFNKCFAMGIKNKIEAGNIYFLTMTVVDWVDIFTREDYRFVIVDSLKYCQKEKGFEIYAWCLMSNHLHLIASAKENIAYPIYSAILKNLQAKLLFKKSLKFQKAAESGCSTVLNLLADTTRKSSITNFGKMVMKPKKYIHPISFSKSWHIFMITLYGQVGF